MALNDAALVVAANALDAAITHVQIHAGDPGAAGTSNLAGGSPARQAVTLGVDGDGDITLTTPVTFTGITASSATTFISVWSALTAGTHYGNFALTGDQTANAAGEYELTALTLTGTAS
jgi:hypothetical protein